MGSKLVHLHAITFETDEHIDSFLSSKIEDAIKQIIPHEDFRLDLVSSYDKGVL